MSKNTLYDKVFGKHIVRTMPSGEEQIFVGLHLLHEVTSPQAFSMLKEANLSVFYPSRAFATVDHIIPTKKQKRPFHDPQVEAMVTSLEVSTKEHGIRFFSQEEGNNGIVHVIGPERGLTQPGMVIVCGDSHTSTHGAFGALAFGIGTSQVRDVLATQTLVVPRCKVRRIRYDGTLPKGVYAKDVILNTISRLGSQGGVGYAYEYAGAIVKAMSMEERMTLCNMSIEGGARCGYICPDETTYRYIKGREYAPRGDAWERALAEWNDITSDDNAVYDDEVVINGDDISPIVTWGIRPDQSIPVNAHIPEPKEGDDKEAYKYMKFQAGKPIAGTPIDVAFLGSCTNGRLEDLEIAASFLSQTGRKVAKGVRALVVPGSQETKKQALLKGLDDIFIQAGFEFREPGCSMCLAMNDDRLEGDQICASSSNRNFKGRQGSSRGRTLLMSPVMVVACATEGKVIDHRLLWSGV